MLWEEKNGGIWSVDLDYGDTLVFVRHVPTVDLIAYLFAHFLPLPLRTSNLIGGFQESQNLRIPV